MSNNYRTLVIAAGGNSRPGETVERYLDRISIRSGIDIFSLWKAWRDQYLSKKTRQRLEKLRKEQRKLDVYDRIAWLTEWNDEYADQNHAAVSQALGIMREMADARNRMDDCLAEIEAIEQAATTAADEEG